MGASTALQSRLFSKISRTFCASRNEWIIVVFLQCTLKEKLPIFLINTLLLHIPLLAHTDRQNDRETNTLAARGLEEPFFQLCYCVSVFWFWQEIGFGVTYVLRVQYSWGIVLVFWFWRETVFGFAYVLSVQYSCAVVSVFWLWRERVLVWSKKKFLLVFFILQKQLDNQGIFLIRSELSNTAYLFLAFYGSTTLQSR